MKTHGHIPVLGAIVVCLLYAAIPARRTEEKLPKPEEKVVQAAVGTIDPKFGAPRPVLRGPVWEPQAFKLRMKIPHGWTEEERRGRPYLMRETERPRQGNISAIKLPNFFGKDLDGLLEENRKELSDNPAFEMDRAQKLRLGGREVLRIDYRGKPADSGGELHFVCVIYRSGPSNVALTVTALEEVWPEIAESVERSLANLQFRSS